MRKKKPASRIFWRVAAACALVALCSCRSLTGSEFLALNSVYPSGTRNPVNLSPVKIWNLQTSRAEAVAAAKKQIEAEIASGEFDLRATRMSTRQFVASVDRVLAQSRALTIGNDIFFNYYLPDYSLRDDDRALLAHEVMHVWQSQNRAISRYSLAKVLWERIKCGRDGVYSYNLVPPRPMLTYRFEQQGAIVQDYALIDDSFRRNMLLGALNAQTSLKQSTACK